MSERIAQAGKRLAAARRHGQCDDARIGRGLFPAQIGNVGADAVDFALAAQMRPAKALKYIEQRIPVGGRRGFKRIFIVFKAGGIPSIRVHQRAQHKAADQAKRNLRIGRRFVQIVKERGQFAAGALKQRVQLGFIRNVLQKPCDRLVGMDGSRFVFHIFKKRRLAFHIKAVRQARMMPQYAQHGNLRRRTLTGRRVFAHKPAAIGIDRSRRRVMMRRFRLVVPERRAQIVRKFIRGLAHVVRQADKLRQP